MPYASDPPPPILSNPQLRVEPLRPRSGPADISRARVPGGWFVHYANRSAEGMFFYPDPRFEWDGCSLP